MANVPFPPPLYFLLATKKISLKVCRKAAADTSNKTQAKFKNKPRGEGDLATLKIGPRKKIVPSLQFG